MDWRFPYIDYALYDIRPDDPKEAAAIRRKAPRFYYNAVARTTVSPIAVDPKAISPSFDDNKTYVVMFLTILFNKG